MKNNFQSRLRSGGEAGMTLLEGVVACMIIAILLAFVLPVASQALSAYAVRSGADHIAEVLGGARALAMSKNSNVTVAFNASTGNYGYDFSSPPDGVPDAADPASPSQVYLIEHAPSGTWINFPGSQNIFVTFNSRGELPIGTPVPVGAQGLSVNVASTRSSATVWVNLRGKAWVTVP